MLSMACHALAMTQIAMKVYDLQWFTINAMKSAFIPFDERLELINERIKPQYTALRAVLAERLTQRPALL